MIQMIGLMVGCYALARLGETIDRKDAGRTVKFLCVLAFIVNLVGIGVLLLWQPHMPMPG